MSELQLGLIALGSIAVVGVLAYNTWQERKHRKLAEQMLAHGHADVLLDQHRDAETFSPAPAPLVFAEDEHEQRLVPMMSAERASPAVRQEPSARIEPKFLDDDSSIVESKELPAAGIEKEPIPVLTGELPPAEPFIAEPEEAFTPPQQPFAPPVSAPEPMAESVAEPMPRTNGVAGSSGDDGVPAIIVSPAIDYVASFELVESVSGDQILRSQRDLLARVSKPIGWAGYNDRTWEWERVVEEGSYRRLRVGLLLADRRGPLGEADLLNFHGAMQNLAEELMAVADLPPRDSALNAAIALDQFCANVDIQVGLNVISQGPVFPGTKIRALAEAAGMVLDSSGRFVRCDDDGHVLYTLANQESAGFSAESMKTMSTHGLVFILDVPCVSHGDRVFAQMLDLARRMADTLRGVLVDDNRRQLTEAMLDPFRRQIGQYQSQLAAKGLPAGGPLTLRLFS